MELDLKMYYNTNLRNLLLIISVTIALLTASRLYITQDKQTNNIILIIALSFLILSIIYNLLFMYEYQQLSENTQNTNINYMWLVLPKLLIIIQCSLIFVIIREFKLSHEKNLSIFQKFTKMLKE